jgi:hypothetical protein
MIARREESMKLRVTLIALVATALLGVGNASVALAKTPPLHEVFFNDPDFALPDIDCGSFTIRETSFEDRVDVITFFDDMGEPVRIHLHVSFSGVLTNLSTGETLRDHATFSQDVDFVDGTFTASGVQFHYTVPHDGLGLATSGTAVFVLETGEILFQAGPSDIEDDLTPICGLLD